MKRILSFVLAICMITSLFVGIVPQTARAAVNETIITDTAALREALGNTAEGGKYTFTISQSLAISGSAGFGKEGERNFEGTVTDLQMQSYLLIRDFRRRINKKGAEYGWPISVYSTLEALWGYDHISSAYSIDPTESWTLIREQVRKHFPNAGEGELDMVLGK